MKAILMTETGNTEVLQLTDIEEPEIRSPTQLKVRIAAAGVNPIDIKLRQRGVFYPDALPAVLGCDGAGEVVSIGANVTRFKLGDAVWFCHGGLGREQGNYAEYTLVDEAIARKKPTSLDYVKAAATPLVLITAWEALFDRGQLQSGQTVLVHAGAGGVGQPMLQDLPEARQHQGDILDRCAQWFDAGSLNVQIAATYPLAQAAAAHAQIEGGHTQGKLVLITGESGG